MNFSRDSPAGDAAAASTVSLAAVARIAAVAAAAAMYLMSAHAAWLSRPEALQCGVHLMAIDTAAAAADAASYLHVSPKHLGRPSARLA